MNRGRVVEFNIGDGTDITTYRAGVLSAFQQLYIAKRMAPLLKGIGDMDMASSMSSIDIFLDSVSNLKDSDLQFIIDTCLSVSSKKTETGWARLATAQGQLMFEDIGLAEMLMVCYNVVKANLEGFTKGLPLSFIEKVKELGAQYSNKSQMMKQSFGDPFSQDLPVSEKPKTEPTA